MRTETLALWYVVVVRWLSSLPAGKREASAAAHMPRLEESGFGLFRQAPAEPTVDLMAELGPDRSDKTGALHPVLRDGHLFAALCFSLLSSRPIAAAATNPPGGFHQSHTQFAGCFRGSEGSAARRPKCRRERSKFPDHAASVTDLDRAHDQIAPSLGAVTYTIGPNQIHSVPQGANAPFN